jgi:hypothetical protein
MSRNTCDGEAFGAKKLSNQIGHLRHKFSSTTLPQNSASRDSVAFTRPATSSNTREYISIPNPGFSWHAAASCEPSKQNPEEASRVLHFGVTAHPTAEWTAQQLREAFPWDAAPRYLLRDRDRIFGDAFSKQVQDMAIEEVLSAPRSPWQRAYVERVIGTIRRECLDHVIVFNEASGIHPTGFRRNEPGELAPVSGVDQAR